MNLIKAKLPIRDKTFNDYSNILDLIDVVINSEDFINDLKLYCDYFEALVIS